MKLYRNYHTFITTNIKTKFIKESNKRGINKLNKAERALFFKNLEDLMWHTVGEDGPHYVLYCLNVNENNGFLLHFDDYYFVNIDSKDQYESFLYALSEEVFPSRDGRMLEDVRKMHSALSQFKTFRELLLLKVKAIDFPDYLVFLNLFN